MRVNKAHKNDWQRREIVATWGIAKNGPQRDGFSAQKTVFQTAGQNVRKFP